MLKLQGPLNILSLEEAYQTVTYGCYEPDILRCHPWSFQKIYTIVSKINERWGYPYTHHFNNAFLTVDDKMPVNLVRFENSRWPLDEKMNIEVEFVDV